MSCEYCLQIGGKHNSGCPNYKQQKSLHYCPICNDGIVSGERYVLYDNKYAHWECFATMGSWELMDFLGLQIREMDDDDV